MYTVRMNLSRRSLLGFAGAAVPLLAKKAKPFAKPLGVQLYTLRTIMPKDTEGTIKEIAAIGYKEVEVLQADMDKTVPLAKASGMTAPSGHFDANIILGKRTDVTWDQCVEQAKKNGLQYVVMPYIAPEARGDLDFYRALADKMNKAGEAVSKAGMQFCYHNHAFEFEGAQGKRPWDVLMERWDKKLVALEVDVFWVSVAGDTPSEFLRRYKGRVPLVHLKDKAFGTPVQFNERVHPNSFKEVGAGTLDFGMILRACQVAGVKHYFVEQDQSTNPLDSIKISFNKIRSMKIES